ncbi:MAG: PAS domain S-box protein [Phormidesmis sp.]
MPELAQFFELTSDLLCVLDAEGRCVSVNPAFERVLGYSSEDMDAQPLLSLMHPHDYAVNQAAIDRLLAAEPDESAEPAEREARFTNRCLSKRGEWRWLEWSVSALDSTTAATEPTLTEPMATTARWLYCIAQDITDQRQAEDTLRQLTVQLEEHVEERTEQLATAQDRYSALLETERQAHHRAEMAASEAQLYADAVQNMQVGLYIWRLEDRADASSLRLMAANAAASVFTGVSSETLIGKRLPEAFPALADTDIPQIYADVVRTGQPHDLGEVPYEDERVEKSVFEVKAFPLPNQSMGIAFEDITQHKQEEAIRQDRDAQLRIIFEQAGVGMARLAPDGRWIQVNQRLCDMLDCEMSELLQKTFMQMTHSDDVQADRTIYDQLLSGDRSQATFEKRYITQRKAVVWTEVSLSTVRDSQDDLLYFIATLQEITERKRATLALLSQKEDLLTVNMMLTDALTMLEQRNRELDQFAYVTSHDLKAPLRAIANLATWIEEDLGSNLPDENKEQFELLKNRVHRMEGLINGLLEYSRIGRTHQSYEATDVGELLADVIDSLSPLGQFAITVAPNMPMLQTKRVPLRQVFANLITNAIKHHNRAEGQVEISVRDVGEFYEFAVADDGPGIEPIYHEKIFTIFQTLKARDELEGTGIGLSLVQKAVAVEGGTITVESEIGKGSVFRFTWPKEQSNPLSFPTNRP